MRNMLPLLDAECRTNFCFEGLNDAAVRMQEDSMAQQKKTTVIDKRETGAYTAKGLTRMMTAQKQSPSNRLAAG